MIFKNCVPFTSCISRINNTQRDDSQNTDVVMSMHNSIEYSDNYLKTSGILLQFCKDVPAVEVNGAIIKFIEVNANTESFGLLKIYR